MGATRLVCLTFEAYAIVGSLVSADKCMAASGLSADATLIVSSFIFLLKSFDCNANSLVQAIVLGSLHPLSSGRMGA